MAELPNAFALVVTAIGILVIALAVRHSRKMTAWVDADEYGSYRFLRLPMGPRGARMPGS